ncbi:MAG TPA: TonB family protein [Lacunisphaera sp.]|nr:TonB family protein [Lacunisphaera sp.]
MKTGIGLALVGCLTAALPAAEPAVPVVVDGPPVLRGWVQPEYPAEAVRAKREGSVRVEFVVEADGSVTRTLVKAGADEAFSAAALAAVQQWKFRPAIEDGQPAADAMQVEVPFILRLLGQKPAPVFPPGERYMPQALRLVPAKPSLGIDPGYPDELEESKLPGAVDLEFYVGADGQVEQPQVIWATHPAFVEISLRAIRRANFSPARKGQLTKRSFVKYPVAFWSLNAKPPEILAANGLTFVSAAPLILPEPRMLIRPVYPRERLLAGEDGKAVAEFTIDEKGQTREINLISADHPEFGAALVAAVEAWAFKPAKSETDVVRVRMQVTQAFTAGGQIAESRLATLLRPGGAGIPPAKGLDRQLKPLWRGFPVYPQALRASGLAGRADIEFVIDREGRARVPRAVSASDEAFGWAAATAISQWVFEQPTKGGEPVDVIVRVPVTFTQPEN